MKSNDLDQHHGFCFTDSKGEILGHNIHRRVRLASISKLITTLWFIEKSPEFQYKTKIFFNPETKELHLKGDEDYVFSRRKMFYLVNQLSALGINEISNLTFDENVIAFRRRRLRRASHQCHKK